MSEHDDLELARRLRDHYRTTAAGGVPASLRATVQAVLVAEPRRRSWRIAPAAAASVALILVIGGAFVVGTRRIAPAATPSPQVASGGSIAPVSTHEPSLGPSASAASGILGEVAVLQGAAIRDAAVAATDDAPFLIGGRTAFVAADCAVPTNFPETPLLRVCSDGLVIGNERPFGIPLVTDFLPSGPGLGFNEAAVVLRVHTHDERAATCPLAYLVACEQAIVVEQVVWRPEAGGAAPIPAVMSILPPQVDPGQCSALRFSFVRCTAVVERARSIIGIGWPDIRSVELDAPSQILLGGFEVASVTFSLVDGTEKGTEVTCWLTQRPGLVCGPSTVESVLPSP